MVESRTFFLMQCLLYYLTQVVLAIVGVIASFFPFRVLQCIILCIAYAVWLPGLFLLYRRLLYGHMCWRLEVDRDILGHTPLYLPVGIGALFTLIFGVYSIAFFVEMCGMTAAVEGFSPYLYPFEHQLLLALFENSALPFGALCTIQTILHLLPLAALLIANFVCYRRVYSEKQMI